MFTVIIAERDILDLFQRFRMLLDPLFSEEIVLTEWNREGSSLEEMLPENIYSLISKKDEWRAIIVNQDNIECRNPFDYTVCGNDYDSVKNDDFPALQKRMAERLACFEKAAENPLTQLTTALCGLSEFRSVITDEDLYENVSSGKMPLYEYMLRVQLDALDLSFVTGGLRTYGMDRLKEFTGSDERTELLLEAVLKKDVASVINIISAENVLPFVKLLGGGDPLYSDPELCECTVENTRKNKLLESIYERFSLDDTPPAEVLCISPRTFDFDTANRSAIWAEQDENRYSRFSEFNLYSDKLKFVLFDILPEENKQYLSDRIRFISFLLVMAGNDALCSSLNSRRVYRADAEFDYEAIGNFCRDYFAKLRSTLAKLDEDEAVLSEFLKGRIDNKTSQSLFESDVSIPVTIDGEFDRSKLYADTSGIGLSANCPKNRTTPWEEQYRSIEKQFTRYLREPRRAVKRAVSEQFSPNSFIGDERILQMGEFQRDDVMFKLQEEEQSMVDSKTTRIFDTNSFSERLKNESAVIDRFISQRMTRKKTVFVGLVALLAFLFGFISFFVLNNDYEKYVDSVAADKESISCGFALEEAVLAAVKEHFPSLSVSPSFNGLGSAVPSHNNSSSGDISRFSFGASSLMILSAVLLFIASGIVFLVVMRKKLIKRLKLFNSTIENTVNKTEESMGAFSSYLSHACGVMRSFSVLDYTGDSFYTRRNILRKHKYDIEEKMKEIAKDFDRYINFDTTLPSDTAPFEYDFSVNKTYSYDFPYPERHKSVYSSYAGSNSDLPVDYLKSVTIVREELYD